MMRALPQGFILSKMPQKVQLELGLRVLYSDIARYFAPQTWGEPRLDS